MKQLCTIGTVDTVYNLMLYYYFPYSEVGGYLHITVQESNCHTYYPDDKNLVQVLGYSADNGTVYVRVKEVAA